MTDQPVVVTVAAGDEPPVETVSEEAASDAMRAAASAVETAAHAVAVAGDAVEDEDDFEWLVVRFDALDNALLNLSLALSTQTAAQSETTTILQSLLAKMEAVMVPLIQMPPPTPMEPEAVTEEPPQSDAEAGPPENREAEKVARRRLV